MLTFIYFVAQSSLIGPTIIMLIFVISVIIFMVVEHYIKKHLALKLENAASNKIVIYSINKFVSILFLVMKIFISIFGYVILGLLFYFFKDSEYINNKILLEVFLAILIVSILLIINMKIGKKDITRYLNIFFLLGPYILSLIYAMCLAKSGALFHYIFDKL